MLLHGVFVDGTNPDVIPIIEARKKDSAEVKWYYGLARQTAAAVAVNLDKNPVLKLPIHEVPTNRDTYMNYLDPVKSTTKETTPK